jgi:hypothetical protein
MGTSEGAQRLESPVKWAGGVARRMDTCRREHTRGRGMLKGFSTRQGGVIMSS